MPFSLPLLYPIADMDTLRRHGMGLTYFVQQVLGAGTEILQLRDKSGSPGQVLAEAAEIAALAKGSRCLLVMNDRADLAQLAGWRAVHVGHRDLPPAAARQVLGHGQGRGEVVIGISTHHEEQVRTADAGLADYIAIGPVFATGTKADAEPVVGLEGVRRARQLTRKPLVAIGGIGPEQARAVREAGADSVAMIGGLFRAGRGVETTVRELLQALR